MSSDASFASRLERVRERMAQAAQRVGRSADEITLVAVSKRQGQAAIAEAQRAGLLDFGENYVQEAQEKSAVSLASQSRWNMLGHLQSNKVRAAIEIFDLIQSVDSVRLAAGISREALACKKIQQILLQVHLGTDETKFGISLASAINAANEIQSLPGVELKGLMGIASQTQDARPQFQALYGLFESLPEPARVVLSMGMTDDFEAGIEEGATMVRIGTALFGARR